MKKNVMVCLALALQFVVYNNALSQQQPLSPTRPNNQNNNPISITVIAQETATTQAATQGISALVTKVKGKDNNTANEGKGTKNDPAQPIVNIGGNNDTTVNYVITTSYNAPIFLNLTPMQSLSNAKMTFSRPVKSLILPRGIVTIRDEEGNEYTIDGTETNGKHTFDPPVRSFTIVSMNEDAAANLGLQFSGNGRAKVTAKSDS